MLINCRAIAERSFLPTPGLYGDTNLFAVKNAANPFWAAAAVPVAVISLEAIGSMAGDTKTDIIFVPHVFRSKCGTKTVQANFFRP